MNKVMVKVEGGKLSEEETNEYVSYLQNKFKQRTIESVVIEVDGDYVNLRYKFVPEHFERIRRITGYITGDLSTWNDAKKAEERDRVKHI